MERLEPTPNDWAVAICCGLIGGIAFFAALIVGVK